MSGFRFSLLIILWPLLSACSLSAEMWSEVPSLDKETLPRESPDFISGEKVITTIGTPGFEVNAVLGETDSKTTSLDGRWEVEGVFYE